MTLLERWRYIWTYLGLTPVQREQADLNRFHRQMVDRAGKGLLNAASQPVHEHRRRRWEDDGVIYDISPEGQRRDPVWVRDPTSLR